VAGERAEEGVVAAGLEPVAGHARRGRFATADHLGRAEHARVTGGHVARGRTGLDRIARERVGLGGRGDHDVVAHRRHRQLAGVLQFQGDGLAGRRDGDFLLVELHVVARLELDRAVGSGLRRAGSADQGQGEERLADVHGGLRGAWLVSLWP